MSGEKKEITIDDMFEATESTEEVQSVKTSTKRAGRPRNTEEKADKRVVIYLTPSQLEEVEEYCFRSKKKVGTYIREVFFKEFFENSGDDLDAVSNFIDKLDEKKLGKIVKNYLKG